MSTADTATELLCQQADTAIARAEGRSDAPETRTDLWDPFGNDGMRHMESADVTGGATDMVDNAPERAGLRREIEHLRQQRDELLQAAKAAMHYMRLHKYADQAWADDLERAIARAEGRSDE